MYREIQQFVGSDIPLIIVAEVAGNGNALAEPWTMTSACHTLENDTKKHTPLAHLLDIFATLYRKEDWIGYVMCCPGDYTAKVQNIV
jgi:hypothetical protein